MKLFFILFNFLFNVAVAETDCLAELQKNTCLTVSELERNENASTEDNIQAFQNQSCQPGTEIFVSELTDLFHKLPEHTKEAFCYIKRIYVVPGEVPYGAAAQLSYDLSKIEYRTDSDGRDLVGFKPNGFILRISKKYRFDVQETAEEYASRNLQQNFGVNVRDDGLDLDKPYVKFGNPKISSLYTTLVHEIGHFLDFSDSHSHIFNYVERSITIEDSEWSNLSWFVDDELPRPFPNLDPRLVARPYQLEPELYIKLLKDSAFTSFYSTYAPPEDFAEHYLYSVLEDEYSIWHRGVKLLSNTYRDSLVFDKKTRYILDNLEPGFINFQKLPLDWKLKKHESVPAQICKHPK